jgi:hypothetical protein
MQKLITYTVYRHFDKLQLSFDSRLYGLFLGQLTKKYGKGKPIKTGNKFIYQYRAGDTMMELIKWRVDSFYGAIIVHDPDDGAQQFFAGLADYYSLSQVELAFDFYPKDPNDLYLLKCALAHKVVLRHGRKDASGRYKSKDTKGSHWHCSTAYLGNKGNVRRAPKGVKIYTKKENPFVRLEVNLNKPVIKMKKIALPIDINNVKLSDFVFTRNNLDSERLVALLVKRTIADPLRWAHARSYVNCISCGSSVRVVSEQISAFREMLPGFANRIGEFFHEAENLLDGRIVINIYHDIP